MVVRWKFTAEAFWKDCSSMTGLITLFYYILKSTCIEYEERVGRMKGPRGAKTTLVRDAIKTSLNSNWLRLVYFDGLVESRISRFSGFPPSR